jgi:hypothetical protein
MHMIDKPVTKPHFFFIIHRFNFRHNSNFIRTNMQEFSYPCIAYGNTIFRANSREDFRGEFSNR